LSVKRVFGWREMVVRRFGLALRSGHRSIHSIIPMQGTLIRRAQAEAGRTTAPWGTLCWTASRELGGLAGLTLGRVTLNPGHCNPRHSHPNCDEALYVLSGRLEHSVDGEVVVLEAGDTLIIPAGVPHQARNLGTEAADTIVAYSSGEREFKLEPGGWS
jgi:quercetin dioxygenase-like cupin family protein